MQVAVLKLDVHCEKLKQKAMATVCRLSGVKSVGVKDDKLTVTGEIDTYIIVKKLKKVCYTEIISVGPVKEPEKKPDPKKPPEPPEVVYWYPPQVPPYYQHFNGCVYEDPNTCVIS
ncbi:PREDICTED: uncharacterized protein LOC104725786 [Camelina sativa]|uniref:Uncharacterized protein LOC104725786 n=1 Tax=Camelina sativa TaxID=90675 RepID=A0ABM0UL95_CAMSA|nr:PREDICTED: uncharacterized protein LOC104725786 [Camelina sativa]